MASQVLIVASSKSPNTHTIEIIPGHLIGKSSMLARHPDATTTTVTLDSGMQIEGFKKSPKRKRKNSKRTVLAKGDKKKVSSDKTDAQQENPKKKAGILCSFSQCSCTDRKCVVYRTIKKQVIEAWTKFIQENDSNPRVHKGVRLCKCHFRNLTESTPNNEKLKILLKPEILTSTETNYHKDFQSKISKINERLMTIEESLSKFLNEDQVKKLMDEKPFVHYSDKTVEESYELYKACGVKGYQLLVKRGYPLPTIRTLQRMRRRKNKEEASNEELQEQIYTIEAIIDEENV